MKSNTGQIKLNLFGGTSGLLSSIPLRMESANSNYIPIDTKWDSSISYPAILNSTSSGIVNINWTDYSNHRYDVKYDKDKNHQLYNISSSWNINDVDLLDDIAVVGMKDWTSTEKYTTSADTTQVSIDTFANVAIGASNVFTGLGDVYGNNPSTTLNLTTINIKNIVNSFQKPEFLNNHVADDNTGDYRSESNTPLGKYSLNMEFPDYSDIYLDIAFTGDSEYVYSFGGFLSVEEYIERNQRMSYSAIPSSDHTIKDNEGYKWYIVYRKTSGDYLFVTLSSYKIPTSILTIANLNSTYANTSLSSPTFTKVKNTTDYGTALSYTTGGLYLVQNSAISVTSLKIVKVANFLACGKVDIYTKKKGFISSYTNNTISSSAHGLLNGDVVTIENGLNSTEGITNINGVRYVSGVTTNTFNIYHDPLFQHAINIENLRSVDGVTWNCNGPNQWTYQHTLYSPQGKNGYGFSASLRTASETGINSTIPYERAIESSPTDSGIQKYQSYLNSWISWNNFYPFERAAEELVELPNGNKFGSRVQLGKISSNQYLLMVTEPGANYSFKAYDDFIVDNWLNPSIANIDLPVNKIIMPKYLPYGRVHFYKITKSPYSIEYFRTASAPSNPWLGYQELNLTNTGISNYPIQVDDFRSIYNLTNNNYWVGSRFYSWRKDYEYYTSLGINMPVYTSNPNEFAFADSMGKGAAFVIDGNTVYCAASTNIKSADFFNNSGIFPTNAATTTFSCNLTTSDTGNFSIITNQIPYLSNVAKVQNDEIKQYGTSVKFDGNKLFIGWPSLARNEEYIYYYLKDGTSYNLSQTITSQGNNGFGSNIAVDNDFLVSDRISAIDDSGNLTLDVNYAYIYQRNNTTNLYYYLNRISPTIDLTNPQYQDYSSEDLVFTQNLSYDNTTTDSATQKINIRGKYDINKYSIVLRDSKEYIYYTYDSKTRTFISRNHSNAFDSEDAVIRFKDGNVIEGGQYLSSTEIVSKSYPYINYPTLFLKAIDGTETGYQTVYIRGHITYPDSGTNLVMRGPFIPTGITSGINLYVKQPDVLTQTGTLFIKQLDIYNSTDARNLVLYADQISSDLTLVMGSMTKAQFPLLLKSYEYANGQGGTDTVYSIGDSDTALTLTILNSYTGVPNVSGQMGLHIMPFPFDDYAQLMNLVVNSPASGSASGINLFISDINGTGYGMTNLYLDGPLYASGTKSQGEMALFMERATAAQLPLFVYNTVVASGLNMFMDSAYIQSGNATLFVSGKYTSNSGINLFTFGTIG